MINNLKPCGRCHTCGTALTKCLDGEEYCPSCRAYRRYFSHGWSASYKELSACINPKPQANWIDEVRDE